ncbi:hypothetical protein ABZW30_20940 [Kitasatospora sp. NPDC004669]|uniref:hypothetical protein n=1 Tax=Kitasatospora sp. NPDC004669 TaxID=3154555 RepID=UPI0033BD48FD
MNKRIGFNPTSHPDLDWSVARDSHLDDKVECAALAAMPNGLVALANINNANAVVELTPGELRKLKGALVAGQYDHLLG